MRVRIVKIMRGLVQYLENEVRAARIVKVVRVMWVLWGLG